MSAQELAAAISARVAAVPGVGVVYPAQGMVASLLQPLIPSRPPVAVEAGTADAPARVRVKVGTAPGAGSADVARAVHEAVVAVVEERGLRVESVEVTIASVG